MLPLLLALSLSQNAPQPQGNRAGLQQRSGAVPQAAPVFIAPAPQEQGNQNARQGREKPGTDTAIQFGILLVMLAQGGQLVLQVKIMERQTEVADKQRALMDGQNAIMVGQTNIMLAQEALTRQTITIMEESKERSLRAYLSFRPDAIDAGRPDAQSVGVRFCGTIVNRGQTPAYGVQIWTGVRILPPPFPEHHVIVMQPSVGVLAPDADVGSTENHVTVVRLADFPEYRAGRRRVYYFGVIRYEDAFRKRWEQRFCVHVEFAVDVNGKTLLNVNDSWNDEVCIYGQT